MDLVRRRWRTKRVFANKVYNEYISDRHHVHMNATIWESLSSFVKYLGRTKQCDVDQTEKGWYVKYIDRDPDILAQQEAIKKKEKMDMDDDMRNRERIQKMIAAHQEIAENAEKESEIENDDDEEKEIDDVPEDLENKETNSELEKVQFKFAPTAVTPLVSTVTTPTPVKKISFLEETPIKEETEPEQENAEKKRRYSGSSEQDKRKKQRKNDTPNQQLTALEELTSTIKKKQSIREEQDLKKKLELEKLQQEEKKEQITSSSKEPNDNWIIPGLVVKIMNKKVGDGSYYGKKAKIVGVVDLYIAIIQLLDSNIKLKIDQAHLETVIPAIGSDIIIVNGEHRGKVGILEEVNVDTYKAIIRADDIIVHKDYEDVCKISD